MTTHALPEYLEVAEKAAREAGRLLEQREGQLQVRNKGWADLVTNLDVEAQRVIRGILLERFPDHGFVGEEGDEGEGLAASGEFRWIVDPLDGTTNYVHGYPFYGVSIALEFRGELLVGVVYDPRRDECFRGVRGEGAWLGEQPLRASANASLAEALVVTSFPPGVRRGDEQVEHFIRVLERARSVRRTGSAALNLAYVAAGRFDAFWGRAMHNWDVAAGVLLVQEAGGRCTDLEGRPYRVETPALLATNGSALHEELLSLFHGAP